MLETGSKQSNFKTAKKFKKLKIVGKQTNITNKNNLLILYKLE